MIEQPGDRVQPHGFVDVAHAQSRCASPLPADSSTRLRHEGRVQAVTVRDAAHDAAYGDEPVGDREHAARGQIEFVLTRAVFVVGARDRDAHRFERDADREPCFLAAIVGRRNRNTNRHRSCASSVRSVGVEFEQIKFDFEPGGDRLHHIAGVFEHALERRARTAFERRAVGHLNVAQDPRFNLAVFRPRQYDERRQDRGLSTMSTSSPRTKPSIEPPSNVTLPSNASSSSLTGIETLF